MRFQSLAVVGLFAKIISGTVHGYTQSPSVVPFWWTYVGTPVLDGLSFYAIVNSSPPPLPGLTQIWEAFSFETGDYLYTTDQSEYNFAISAKAGSPGYTIGDFHYVYIFADNEPDTVPLYRFWNGRDHFFTTVYDEGASNGYGLEGITGYVYLGPFNGAVPFYRWREDDYTYYLG